MKKLGIFSAAVVTWACSGQSTAPTPYHPGDITVIGENLGGKTERRSQCGDECSTVDDKCGSDAAADVVVDEAGEVADVICYRQDVDVQEVGIDSVDSAEAGNNTVLVLDAVDDGDDVRGDVTVKGNNAVVWGDSPDVSVIGGSLEITKNNAVVHGVRIHGDVAVTKNNAQFSFCVIEGDLTITGNNVTLAECVVWGKVKVAGVNTVLAENRFASAYEIKGKNIRCNENFAFDDTNANGRFDASEATQKIDCSDSKDDLAPQSDVDVEHEDAAAPPSTADAG